MPQFRKPAVQLGESPPRTQGGLAGAESPVPEESAPDRLLTALYDRLSHQIAGGQRTQQGFFGTTADEGFLPEEYRQDLPEMDWFDPASWIQADPTTTDGVDLSQIPEGGPVREGKGMDFYRAGEAPNNATNRNNPLYQARRDFAVAANRQIRDMFSVTDQGSAGYYRPRASGDDAPGGRSGNSDHYSAGAIDYFGSKEELTRLRNWLMGQPFVSFVRWQSESHFDHLHVSFDLNYVAKNYWGGEMPSFTSPEAPQERTATQQREQQTPNLPRTQTTESLEVPKIT